MKRALATLCLSVVAACATAQPFPSKPIRFIVPYPPGGGTDVVARLVGQKLSVGLGQPVVIENKAGGNEIIGTDAVAKAPPDGYTIGLVSSTFSVNATLSPKLPYRPDADFTPVASLVSVPMLALVPASSPHKDLASFVAAAKAKPGTLFYASLGPTSLQAISTEWFKHVAGIDVKQVSYKGAAPAMSALATDEVQFMFAGVGAANAMLQANRVKPLAVSTSARVGAAPNAPPIASTYPSFDLQPWYAVLAPAGTPAAVVGRLNEEIGKALADPEVKQRLVAQGFEPLNMSPPQLAGFLKKDVGVWANMIKAGGIKPE